MKRNKECVIRYFLRYENDQEYHRALCVLFLPFRNEMAEIHSNDVSVLYKENEDQIEFIRSKFEKHKRIVDLVAQIEKNQEAHAVEIDEDDEDFRGFEPEETTSNSDIDNFIKEMKAGASASLRNSYPVEKIPNDDYLEKINSLNNSQRRIFDDVVERLMDVESAPFYLYIGGEAGTGKSYLLRLLNEAAKRIPKFSGKDLNKPVSLTMAPTGVAAYIIKGSTIHGALNLMPGRATCTSVGSQAKNSELRFIFEDLKVIFLDEISMVGSNTLCSIDLRLQHIRGTENFMGGVSLICFGDFGQLPPVRQNMIWGASKLDGRLESAPNHWDTKFKIYYMKEKMRSTDNRYSDICDEVRKGEISENVTKYLKSRVLPCENENNLHLYQHGKISIIVTKNSDRDKINMEKLESLLSEEESVIINSRDKSTNIHNAPPIDQRLPLTQTGQLEGKVILKKGAPIMITSNSQEPKYKMNGIVNGMRGWVDSFQYSRDDPTVLEVIWVRFTDDKTGQLLRMDNLHYLQFHKPDDRLAVPLTKQKKTFSQKGNTVWLRDQFPLTLCFAVTAHKVRNHKFKYVCVSCLFKYRVSKERRYLRN